MFAPPVPSSASVSTSSQPPLPTGSGSSRPSRLRGLSYLRNYTQQHLSLHSPTSSSTPSNQRNNLLRSISYPSHSTSSQGQAEPSSEPPATLGELSNSNSPATEEPSSKSPESPEDSTNMARFRSENPTRRNQSVPAAEARTHSTHTRVSRTTSSNDTSTSTAANASAPTNGTSTAARASAPTNGTSADGSGPGLTGLPPDQMPTIKFIPHQDVRSGKPSLSFPATSRTLPHEDCVIRVGRYSERDGQPNPPPHLPSAAPVGFKSKVVSRRHCEFWCSQGQWYIKDVKSSSGTFLNHIRLSQPSVESRPFPVNDGDIVQLGIDFRGGEEMIFRCVKIRIECNRNWQKGLNNFNMNTHKRIRALGKSEARKDSDNVSSHSSECAICLMSIAPCQSLFVAPCSHVWHFKCIRPMLNDHKTYPQFMCPNCRAMADLEADVDDPLDDWDDADIDIDPHNTPPSVSKSNSNPNTNRNSASESIPEQNSVNDGTAAAQAMLGLDFSRQLSLEEQDQSDPPLTPYRSLYSANPNLVSRDSATTQGLLSRRLNSGRPSQFGPIDEATTSPTNHLEAQFDDLTHAPWMEPRDGQHMSRSAESSGVRGSGLLRTPTPTATGERLGNEGPLTPRNDVGPFVFDGAAGRSARRVPEDLESVVSEAGSVGGV